jgi:hypothetical protein
LAVYGGACSACVIAPVEDLKCLDLPRVIY